MPGITKLVVRALVLLVIGFCYCVPCGRGLTAKAPSGAGLEQSPGELYILTIGINVYADPAFHQMFAVRDAESLAESFELRGKRRFKKIHKVVLRDAQARKANLEQALDSMARNITSDDTFVFGLAGNGFESKGSDGGETKSDFYLFPQDGKRSDLSSLISGKLIRSYFRRIRARNQFLIIDSCDSSVGFESLASRIAEPGKEALGNAETNIVFVGTDTITYESSKLGHGIITAALLEGLSEGADYNKDGLVSARELEAFFYCRSLDLAVKEEGHRPHFNFHARTVSRGKDFGLGFTDSKLAALEKGKSATETSKTGSAPPGSTASRSAEPVDEPKQQEPPRKGTDYALLVATDTYDNWRKLANPVSDAEAMKQKLMVNYGFKEENVHLESNPTRGRIRELIAEYKGRKFENKDDQLFIFFAGHGTVLTETGEGYLVTRDSPAHLNDETEGKFIQLDRLLALIDQIPCEHTFVVLDACYVGVIWKLKVKPVPQVALLTQPAREERAAALPRLMLPGVLRMANWRPETSAAAQEQVDIYAQLPKSAYIKRKIKTRTRIIFTAGDRPVYDGEKGKHSPFARAFMDALDQGGSNKYGILSTGEIYSKLDALVSEPQRGSLSGSDGDFVFIASRSKVARVSTPSPAKHVR